MLNWLKRFWILIKVHLHKPRREVEGKRKFKVEKDSSGEVWLYRKEGEKWVNSPESVDEVRKQDVTKAELRMLETARLDTPFTREDFLVRDIEMQNIRK